MFNPWIRCTISTSPRNQKRKWPNLESMSCSLHMVTCHVKMSSSVLSWASLKNGCCRGFQLCRTWWKWKRRCPVLRQAVSTLTRPTGVKPEKWTAVSLYLDELLIQKCKFRDRFTVNCQPRKAFPEGLIPPCRNSAWVTHLLRNILSNYWCGMHRTCKKHSSKPDRRWWMTRREKQCRRILPLKL